MPPTSHSRVKTANPKQRDLFQREVVKTVAENPNAATNAAREVRLATTIRRSGRGWNAKHGREVGPLRAYLCVRLWLLKTPNAAKSLEFLLATRGAEQIIGILSHNLAHFPDLS